MFEKFKDSKMMKSARENKAVLVTAVTLVLTLCVITAVATVANRGRRKSGAETKSEVTTKAATTLPAVTDAPADPAADVSRELPSFRLPVTGRLTQGQDLSLQVFSATMGDYRVHVGMDIAAAENTPVGAAADGVVTEVYEDALMGQCLRLSHEGGGETVYRNLAAEFPEGIEAGAAVRAGQTIGYVGGTALCEIAEEPHLHFEMLVDGEYVNPVDYLDTASAAALQARDEYEG